jgi:probable F420-dependent oxidoreductase
MAKKSTECMQTFPVRCGITPVLHGGFPGNDRAGLLGRIARIADEGGFDTLWVEDHTRLPAEEIGASEGEPGIDEPLEAWTTLAYLAGQTTRIRLGTEVTPITLRHPALLAKSVATLDVLSGGRVTLGAGTGWNRIEFTSLGIPFEKRAERFEKSCEAVEVIRALWSGRPIDYAGVHYHLQQALVVPTPVQDGGPPIWFGGFSDQILSAVVRYGQGWILGTNPEPQFVADRWSVLRQMAAKAGRDPSEIRVAVPLMAHLSRDRDKASASLDRYIERGDFGRWLGVFFGENARRYGLWGTPDDAIERLRPYLDLGIRNFIFDLRPPGIAEETATLLASDVLPQLEDM